MRKPASLGLLLGVLAGCSGLGIAQDKSAANMPPPKVLVIQREFIKPGKAGSTHEKTETAFVQAFRSAKWPTTYLAVDSLSGKPRSLFLVGYDSFEAWEKDAQAVQKNATLAAALDRAGVLDGDVQSDSDSGVFVYREDLSVGSPVALPQMRYFEITAFTVRPGHEKDFEDLGKAYVNAYQKIPNTHWATFQSMYGQSGNVYLVFTPMKSASEVDQEMTTGKQVEQSMGEDTSKKLSELSAASIDHVQSNLFIINPRESYVSDEFANGDPTFWKPGATKKMAKAGTE